MSLILIAAVAKNNVIGNANDLPWNIPEDLARFRKLTWGKIVLVGQQTYESLLRRLGKPLPGRKTVLVTFDRSFQVPKEVEVYHDLTKALKAYKGKELWVIGGASIYQQTIGLADKLFITHVDQEVAGDAHFPAINPAVWKKVSEQKHPGFSFTVYYRI